MKDADKNPSGAGQSGRRKYRKRTDDRRPGGNDAPERQWHDDRARFEHPSDNPQRPAGAKDNTGAAPARAARSNICLNRTTKARHVSSPGLRRARSTQWLGQSASFSTAIGLLGYFPISAKSSASTHIAIAMAEVQKANVR